LIAYTLNVPLGLLLLLKLNLFIAWRLERLGLIKEAEVLLLVSLLKGLRIGKATLKIAEICRLRGVLRVTKVLIEGILRI
jgi:hypothetical protein